MSASAWDLVCLLALDSAVSRKNTLVLALTAAFGAGSYAAEDRICEIAERLGIDR